MTLRIVKSSEVVLVERLNLCIYAPPGVGKTTLAFTADEPILLDFDRGVHRAANRKDSAKIDSWADANMTAEDLAPYKTVVVDTAGRALDFLSADIIKGNPKAGRGDGSLTLQGYGALKSRFAAWLKMLNNFGKDVILIAHMDEQRNGDDIVERLDVQGGSKGEIYKSVDAMGRIFIREKKRVIDFSPRENSFGKNPASLEVIEIPDIAKNGHFLADVIQGIKSTLNRQTEEQLRLMRVIDEWIALVNDLEDADDFNRNLPQVVSAPKAVKLYFAQKATAAGLVYNDREKVYEEKEVLAS